MATQTAIGSGSFKNNGATVFNAGNFTSGNVTNSLTIRASAIEDGIYGSKVPTSDGGVASSGNIGTLTAVSAGAFAFNPTSSQWLMKRVSTTIGGVANTFLQSGGSVPGNRNPAALETTRVYGSGVNTSWNAVTGAITKGASAGNTASYNSDHAARPTAGTPGEFSYLVTGKVPTQADYKPRTG